jgi:hypothetical protein
MNQKTMEALAGHVVELVADALDYRVGPLEQRVAALEGTHVKAHAPKPRVKFCGVWQDERLYHVNDAVNHQGKLLICHATHVSTAFDVDQTCWQRA